MAAPATRDYQARVRQLRALTYRDVQALWPRLDLDALDSTFPAFAASVGVIVASRRSVSVNLAAAYLAALRKQRRIATATPRPAIAALDTAAFLGSLRSGVVVSVKNAMTRGVSLDNAGRNALVNAMGIADKSITDAGRDHIRAVSDADPEMTGWTRVTAGGCDWCEGLAGVVLPPTAEMATHPHDGCVPQPVFA